jgi:hypothetical protein
LTFAILFGCPLSVEEEIIRRLSLATAEAAYPLLLPGIFAELERTRHVHVVEAMIDEIETKIFELDFDADETERTQVLGAQKRKQEKRTAYLDTAYLRNGLIGWSAQLSKMVQHVGDLEINQFAEKGIPEVITSDSKTRNVFENSNIGLEMISIKRQDSDTLKDHDMLETANDLSSWDAALKHKSQPEKTKNQMRRAGRKIKDRLEAIIDEYEEKIRDCTMRVEGMAMATQWVEYPPNSKVSC